MGNRSWGLSQTLPLKARNFAGPGAQPHLHPAAPLRSGSSTRSWTELIGPDRWQVTVDYPNYTLYIDSAAENQAWATEVAITVNTIKPCHIVYRSRPYTGTCSI